MALSTAERNFGAEGALLSSLCRNQMAILEIGLEGVEHEDLELNVLLAVGSGGGAFVSDDGDQRSVVAL